MQSVEPRLGSGEIFPHNILEVEHFPIRTPRTGKKIDILDPLTPQTIFGQPNLDDQIGLFDTGRYVQGGLVEEDFPPGHEYRRETLTEGRLRLLSYRPLTDIVFQDYLSSYEELSKLGWQPPEIHYVNTSPDNSQIVMRDVGRLSLLESFKEDPDIRKLGVVLRMLARVRVSSENLTDRNSVIYERSIGQTTYDSMYECFSSSTDKSIHDEDEALLRDCRAEFTDVTCRLDQLDHNGISLREFHPQNILINSYDVQPTFPIDTERTSLAPYITDPAALTRDLKLNLPQWAELWCMSEYCDETALMGGEDRSTEEALTDLDLATIPMALREIGKSFGGRVVLPDFPEYSSDPRLAGIRFKDFPLYLPNSIRHLQKALERFPEYTALSRVADKLEELHINTNN